MSTRFRFTILGLAFATTACSEVTRLEGDTDGDGGGGAPPEVQAIFDQKCTTGTGCHASGGQTPALTPGSNLVGVASTVTVPYVDPYNPLNSYLAIKIQPEVPPNATVQRTGGLMPVGFTLSPVELQTILGWIAAGAPTVEGGDTGMMPMDTGDGSSSGDAEEDDTGPAVEYDEFVPVLEIIQRECGGGGTACHRDGGPFPPTLDDDVAYDNLLGGESAVGGGPFVTPESTDMSFFYIKVSSEELPAGQGAPMPSGSGPLPAADLTVIETWINAGANP